MDKDATDEEEGQVIYAGVEYRIVHGISTKESTAVRSAGSLTA